MPVQDVWSFDGVGWTHFDHDPMPGIQDAPWHAPLGARGNFPSAVANNLLWIMGGFESTYAQGTITIHNDFWNFKGISGTTWTHFDHDPVTPGIQDAPWTTRASSSAVYAVCSERTVDISVKKIVDTSTLVQGFVTYTITIKNSSPAIAQNVNQLIRVISHYRAIISPDYICRYS